ncbi:MAG: aminotransferase class I/II-fold pyridoxal phosphate-dependent enzyme, partial [Deltaproteobacteria bacterium]
PDLVRLEEAISHDDLVFICNPNNPTGQLIPSSSLHALAGRHPEANFVIDESYIAFCAEPSLLHLPQQENVFLLSSFSKAYGIPGLRLGFLSGSASHLDTMQKSGRPWGVNRLAQLAGLYLLRHETQFRSQLLSFVDRERMPFFLRLKDLPGVTPIMSAAHFILSRLEGPVDAKQLQQRLLDKRIMIRNCANFTGLSQRYFRVNLRQPEENDRFFTEIRTVLHP